MSAIASVGQAQTFERSEPVKQQANVANNDQKREVAAENAKQDIFAQQEQREQVKATVNKGVGTLVDKEV